MKWGALIIFLLSFSVCQAQQPATPCKAVAFDFFVIFNPNSIIPEVEKVFPGKGAEFTKAWRAKQFEYCYVCTITERHISFYDATQDALVYTAKALKLNLTPAQHSKLMDAYLHLEPWPDAVDALKKLKQSGLRIVTLSNFDDKMQRANVNNAGLMNLFDALLSTDAKNTFKPSPEAYALGVEKLRLKKEEIVFAAFAGWDAYGSKTFGYKTFWVNRLNLPAEELGNQADKASDNLSGLVKFAAGHE